MLRTVTFWTLLALSLPAWSASPNPDPVFALRTQDQRLGAIAQPLLLANNGLCRQHMPLTGMILHSFDQYAGTAGNAFQEGQPVAISAVVPNSPAALAGFLPDDGVASINGADITPPAPGEPHIRDRAFTMLAETPGGTSPQVTVLRHGTFITRQIKAPSGCRSLIEVLADDETSARSDGRVVQVSYGFLLTESDDAVAVALAHELAHSILEHRRRLSQADVEKGLFGEFGKNRKLGRQAEVEADRLSVHLLANAGYDPAIAPAFWRSDLGRRMGGGLLRSGIYPSPEQRAEQLEQEIAIYLPTGKGPSYPGHLLRMRDEPMK